jgi:hypothetical protein
MEGVPGMATFDDINEAITFIRLVVTMEER